MNQLAKRIHEGNKKRGFFEQERNLGEMLMLIVSEVSEALEADRANNYCKPGASASVFSEQMPTELFLPEFTEKVKNTFEDEIADTFAYLTFALIAVLTLNVT